MDDYAIEIVQNIRDTDEWKRDNTYCERIGICLGFCPKFTRKWCKKLSEIIESGESIECIVEFLRACQSQFVRELV